MSKTLMGRQSFLEDFRASPTARQASAGDVMTTVISGLKCSESSENRGPVGLLEKMLLGSSIWRSTTCVLTWKQKVTRRGLSYYQLAVSALRTRDTGVSSLPMITATDAVIGSVKGKEFTGTRHALKLEQALNTLPTIIERDYKDVGDMTRLPENSILPRVLGKRHGLKLQPVFAEWMMGFPIECTGLDALETQSSLNKGGSHGKC